MSALFYLGTYLGLSDVVFPVQLNELMDGRETPLEPVGFTVGELVLLGALVVCAVKLPWTHVRRFATVFVVILMASEAVTVARGLSRADRPAGRHLAAFDRPQDRKGKHLPHHDGRL